MRSCLTLLIVIFSLTMAPNLMAQEVEEGSEGGAVEMMLPKPKAKSTPKPKPRPKIKAAQNATVKSGQPKPALSKLPSAPIPYATLKSMVKPVTTKVPASIQAKPLPADFSLPETSPVTIPPPLPPPPPPPPVYVPSITTIELKCETEVILGNKPVSKGSFILEISPSDVFPDENARFKVMFADPRHQSLMKNTVCETLSCMARISPNFYDLYNQRTKSGTGLRVTLDRQSGAFLAQISQGKGPMGLSLNAEKARFEQGFCKPQSRPDKLF
jgi:hypothetical protein